MARPSLARALQRLERFIERAHGNIQISGLETLGDALRAAFDREHRGTRHGGGQRLRAAHAAEPCRENPFALEVAAEMLAAHFGEGLVGALHDALAADVDPAAGRHLAEHHQALAIELVEVVPVRPARHEVRIGDEHARRIGVRAEDADRLAGLDQQRLFGARAGAAQRRCGRSSPSCAPPCRCRRRRRDRRAARRPRGRGCS